MGLIHVNRDGPEEPIEIPVEFRPPGWNPNAKIRTGMAWIRKDKDRCDRCGAQAYVAVKGEGTDWLYFCAHHFKDLRNRLLAWATYIYDERGRTDLR